ncbi:MAG: VOC family protein [Lachnospiraceae bacterium]
MSLVKGIHHVSMRCREEEEYGRALSFYRDVLQIPIIRTWDAGTMFDTGSGTIEIFSYGGETTQKGVIGHFALATDDVDACVKAIKEAGFEVFVEPKGIEIASTPAFPARIAFCKGPLGEEIELFQER